MLALLFETRQHLTKGSLSKNFQPALVLFLVALPLNLGVAIASGVPAYMGVVSGVIGALVVGLLSGSPLMVSGPDAGIGVLVLEMIQEQGIAKLGVIVFLAGLFQLSLGVIKLANWYRMFSPAVVNGMLAGMGSLIILTQFHIMLDNKPEVTGIANLAAMPAVILKALTPTEGLTHHPAACIGLVTIAVALLWGRFAKGWFKTIPAPLIAIIVASLVTAVIDLPIQLITISSSALHGLKAPDITAMFAAMTQAQIWICAGTLAFVASAQSLITASAVDATSKSTKSNLDKELIAQGIGNILCGLLGTLPVAGVLLRSMANLQSGATSRVANIMHGIFIVAAVAFCPFILNYMPASALAAILVIIGCRMVAGIYDRVKTYEKSEVAIVAVTVVAILATNLFTGVIVGFFLAAVKELAALAYLGIRMEPQGASDNRLVLHLWGAATFLQLPKLAAVLESVPKGGELHIRLDALSYIDHGCLELLMNWAQRHREEGGELIIDWGPFATRCNAGKRVRRRAPSTGIIGDIHPPRTHQGAV